MLNFLTAAAIAAQPIPTDFDLRNIALDQGQYTHQTKSTINNHDLAVVERQEYNRGVEERRIVFHILNISDLGLTLYCLEKVNGCQELNPIYGQSKTRIVVGKVATAVIYELILDHLRDSGDRDAVRIFQWANIAIVGGVVVWNVSVILN